jgi:hypothetical protein
VALLLLAALWLFWSYYRKRFVNQSSTRKRL